MNALTEKMPVFFAEIDDRCTIPQWAGEFNAVRSTVSDLCGESDFSGIAVVQSTRPRKIVEASERMTSLFKRIIRTPDPSLRLVLGFQEADFQEILELKPLLASFPGLTERVEFALRTEELRDTILEAVIKMLATQEEHDPLSEVKTITEAGRALRAPNGRLDARKIAAAFGISLAELARQIEFSKQRIAKTPDSEALQPLLRHYERVARLRAVLPDDDFKAWLNTPNEHLEDRDAPIDYLKAGAGRQLAAYAENMLTGAAT